MIIVTILCLLISLETDPVIVNAACTWPPDFVDRIWTDSLKGDMDFTSTTMTGWTVSSRYNHINNWECVTYNTSGQFLVMKSTSTFAVFNIQFTGYRCLMLEKITDVSYRYYQMNPAEIRLLNDRLIMSEDSSLNDTNVLCSRQPATGSEFQMMLRKGYEGSAAVTCPYSLLADYNFTYQQSDGTVSCDSVNDVGYVGMCANVTQFRVPSLTCSPYPFYSSEDTVWCVDVVVVGTDTFVGLYNGLQEASSIDETNTYRFTCVGINAERTSMSVTPQHCKANQSSTEVPTDNAGCEIGAVLSLSINGDTCPPCPLLSNPAKGSVVKSTNGAVTKATYSCERSFRLNGNDTRVCEADGTWSGSEPSCTTCPTLTDIASGNVTLVSNSSTTIATYYCASGYTLIGDNTSVCTATGVWDSTQPICVCNAPPPPGNGTVTISDDLAEAVYTCWLGFTLQGSSTRNCRSDGSGWSNTHPICVACTYLENPRNGTVTLSTNGTLTVASYTCDVGFSLKGEVHFPCQTDGTWSNALPSCSQCGDVPPISSGSFTLTSDGIITYAKYSCKVGTTINSDVIVSCNVKGDWSNISTNTSCVECPTLSETGGIYTISSNGTKTTAKLTCSVGYVLVGSDTVECQSNGSWTTSSTQSECVSTSEPAEGSSNGNNLLEVVIVVAILTLGLAAALGGSVLYIRKLKKTTIRAYFLNK